jgi:hypothetical protein
MKGNSIKLYSLAAPLFAMPIMSFGWDQIVPYIKGAEFRTFLAEILSQVAAGIVDAAITAGVTSLFS